MSANEAQQQVHYYNGLVRQYEELDAQIRALLSASGGKTDNLRADNLAHYRALARQRDELFSEMRSLEQQLFTEE
jgi:hypothetical protein